MTMIDGGRLPQAGVRFRVTDAVSQRGLTNQALTTLCMVQDLPFGRRDAIF